MEYQNNNNNNDNNSNNNNNIKLVGNDNKSTI